MAKTEINALQNSDLNAFLFADVGIEASGMALSVLSTLARRGLDPWREAARLAELSRSAAAEGLARTIAAMPASPWSLPDAGVIAKRLVTLLPARGAASAITPRLPTASGVRSAWPWVSAVVLLGTVLVGLLYHVAG